MKGVSRMTGAAVDAASEDYLELLIGDVLTTPTGTRFMRRDYGSLLPDLIDQPVTPATPLRLFAAAATAVMRWVPLARLRKLQLVAREGGAPGAFNLRLQGERRDRPAGLDAFDYLIPLNPAVGRALATTNT